MKQCSKCKQTKNKIEFAIDKNSSNGLHSVCKVCHREYTKNHYKII